MAGCYGQKKGLGALVIAIRLEYHVPQHIQSHP
jgi:hypothetical protein